MATPILPPYSAAGDPPSGQHVDAGHARNRPDGRLVVVRTFAGIAGGLAANPVSNHVGAWSALPFLLVSVLFAAAWLRRRPATSWLRTTATTAAITATIICLAVAGFGPRGLQLPVLLAGALLTTLATLTPDNPLRARDTLTGVAFIGIGVVTLELGVGFLLRHQTLQGVTNIGLGVAVLGLGAGKVLEGRSVRQWWRALVTERTRARPGPVSEDGDGSS
jgi:hypothetical protein